MAVDGAENTSCFEVCDGSFDGRSDVVDVLDAVFFGLDQFSSGSGFGRGGDSAANEAFVRDDICSV